MRAQELANDLAHQLELTEAERDEAVRERDEAQAVVDAVRKVRDRVKRSETTFHRAWSETDDEVCRVRAIVFGEVAEMLDGIDGL